MTLLPTYLRQSFVLLILSGLFSFTMVHAQETKIVLISLDSIMIPIPLNIQEPTPDTTAPNKPQLTTTLPSETYENSMSIEISGEKNTKVYVNNQYVGTIGSTGKIQVNLDTSGANGVKTFNIIIKDSAGNTSQQLSLSITKSKDPKFNIEYKGLTFYHENEIVEDYTLAPLTDTTFNTFSQDKKEKIANKLLTTLFFAYPYDILKEKIASGSFIENILSSIQEETTDKASLESYIKDDDIFQQRTYNEQEAVDILVRFYAMKNLDKYYLENWIAYILTQTIMFSPAYELESTHTPNIARVYNRLVVMLGEDSGMRYMTYVHMMSEDNWRRFRSPEDNGREMLEIFTLDKNDSHVPIAGQALQNWKLDSDNDTLVVGLNQNRVPLNLFNTTIYNGDDFYRELVKSDLFTYGAIYRLVSFFFTESTVSKQKEITQAILLSHPETWQDILLQIVFSEEYLLHSSRVKSAEELFYSMAKKTDFKHRRYTFHEFKDRLEEMHQASMKYKLGKTKRVPLDTLSFAHYHKYIRERILLRKSDPNREYDYNSWSRQGWAESFLSNQYFNLNENDAEASLVSLIQYIFHTMLNRDADKSEVNLFKDHMLELNDGTKVLDYNFNIVRTHSDPVYQLKKREEYKRNIAIIVLDYISRLVETYTLSEVN